jgi:putative restriction endonuclease
MTGIDEAVRLRAFEWLKEQESIHGGVLPRTLLEKGFEFEGERIPLISPQGIFKPRYPDHPLSITTSPKGPYDDSFSSDGYLLYKYRGTDPFIETTSACGKQWRRGCHWSTFAASRPADTSQHGRCTSKAMIPPPSRSR